MMLTDKGLRLSKPELSALLAFAATDTASSYYGVHFKTTTPPGEDARLVKARATDGIVAVDAFGPCTLDEDREWFVSRAFLAGLSKLADSTHHVVLRFSGASLHEAAVERDAGVEIATFAWPGGGAATAQMTFLDGADWDRRLKLPARARGVKCVPLKTSAFKLLIKLGVAADAGSVDCFAPAKEDDRVLVRAEGVDTLWIAALDPALTPESDEG
jgi:hypothetical protein